MSKRIDLIGQRFGKWIVLSRAPNDRGNRARWNCMCDCGSKVIVNGKSLRNGTSLQCSHCKSMIHGLSGTRIYRRWKVIIQRCENPNNPGYKNYGGRGIRMCPEWREDFMTFREWALTHGYKYFLTIDRINNDGDYEPNNCRFTTMKEQCRNSRQNRLVKIGDEVKLLIEWAELAGLFYATLYARIKANWPEHRLLEPVHR